jgi:hypothetical protein
MPDCYGLFDGNRLRSVERLKDLRARTNVGPNQGYFALDADTLDHIDLGRDEFQRQFGYPPAEFADHHPGIDFTQLDILMPHPMYGRQSWASIINPNPRRQDIDQLISQAHGRAQQRENRRQHRNYRLPGGNYSSTAAIRCERSSSTNRAPNRVPPVVA